MDDLAVQIVRFVDSAQPGFVAFEFMDAEGRRNTFVDKVPIFAQRLDESSTYPQAGVIRCEVLGRWQDSSGHQLVRVTTEMPDHVKSTEGVTEFVVLSTQLSADPRDTS